MKQGRAVGILCLVHSERRNWTGQEVELAAETAERIWSAVARAHAEEALRVSEEQFRRAVEEAPIPIIMQAEDGTVLQISRTWTELTGYTLEDFPTLDAWLTLAYGEGANSVRDHVHALFEGAVRTLNVEFVIRTKRGEPRHWSFSASSPGKLQDGRRFLVGMALDITGRAQSEEQRLQLAQETTLLQERNRMAQELHDTLAQGFTGIKLQIDLAEEALEESPSSVQEALRHVRRAREVAQQSHLESRQSIRALRSPMLEDVALIQAFEQMAAEASDGVKATFTLEGTPLPLSGLVENDLYRIGQEALTNALRHGQAQHVFLLLTYGDEAVSLSVRDDGQGFDPQVSRRGFGMTGMQERAERLGADLQILSLPGQGTEVRLVLPLPVGKRPSATIGEAPPLFEGMTPSLRRSRETNFQLSEDGHSFSGLIQSIRTT